MKATATKRNLASAPSSLGAVVVTFFLLALLGVFLSPWVARALIQSQLSKTTGLPVSLGNVHFSVTGPRFSIKDLQFSNPRGFPSAPLAQVSEVKARYSPLSAVLGRPHFKRLQVTFREFRLMRNESGSLNLPSVAGGAVGRADIDELELTLVPLTYTDLSSGQPTQKTYDMDLIKSVYRNVKGVAGIVEILNWEILKRTGLPEKVTPAPPQVKPTASETPVIIQMGPAAAPQAPAESTVPSQAAPSSASATQEAAAPPSKAG